jgi:hypothetical protein
MTEPLDEVVKIMRAAERRNASRDARDRRHGFAAPADAPPMVFWNTIMMALGAGLTELVRNPDKQRGIECVAEAAAMLGQIPGIYRFWDDKHVEALKQQKKRFDERAQETL